MGKSSYIKAYGSEDRSSHSTRHSTKPSSSATAIPPKRSSSRSRSQHSHPSTAPRSSSKSRDLNYIYAAQNFTASVSFGHYASSNKTAPPQVPSPTTKPPSHPKSSRSLRERVSSITGAIPPILQNQASRPAPRSAAKQATYIAVPLPTSSVSSTSTLRHRTISAPSTPLLSYKSVPCTPILTTNSITSDYPRRPTLKQSYTWPKPAKSAQKLGLHVSFTNPNRAETLHMHPLLASSKHYKAPISYDVTFPPSSASIVDRSTRCPVDNLTLAQPATDPGTFTKITLKSDKFPWPIVATSSSAKSASSWSAAFSGGKHRSKAAGAVAVTNYDVLAAIHHTLAQRITQQEWAALGQASRAQRKATRAYEQRCLRYNTGWDDGVRRVDLLGEKTRLVGIEVDQATAAEGRVARMIFARP